VCVASVVELSPPAVGPFPRGPLTDEGAVWLAGWLAGCVCVWRVRVGVLRESVCPARVCLRACVRVPCVMGMPCDDVCVRVCVSPCVRHQIGDGKIQNVSVGEAVKAGTINNETLGCVKVCGCWCW
jgi:hypothetical protein